MRFIVDRKEALSAVKKTSQIVPEHSPVKELSGILMTADENTGALAFTGTDYEISIKCDLKASVEIGGSTVINAKILLGMLTLLDGKQVSFDEPAPHLLRVSAESAEYVISTLPAENYPATEIPVPERMVRLSGVRKLAKSCAFAAGKDGKPILQCVKLEIGTDSLCAMASDGLRLMSAKNHTESGGTLTALIPAASFKLFAGMANDTDAVYMGIKNHRVIFFQPDLLFCARIIEERYMDVDAVLAAPGKYQAIVKASDFCDAIETVTAIADGISRVHLLFRADEIAVSCDGENTSAQTTLTAKVLAPMPNAAGFFYKAADLAQCARLMEGTLAISVSEQGVLLIANGCQKYMQSSIREAKREPKKEVKPEKPTKPVKKTKPSKKTAAKAA